VLFDDLEVHRVVHEAQDLQVRRGLLDFRGHRQEDDREDAGALLAGGLRDELLDPVRQTHDVRAVRHEPELVTTGMPVALPAMAAARTSAGLRGSSIATSSSVASASSRSSEMSTPARPDGTRPKAVRAEYLPPTVGSALKTR
jgi:hypothetical protein